MRYQFFFSIPGSSAAVGVFFLPLLRAQAENHVDYRYEDYREDGGRIHVRTHGMLFEQSLTSWLTLKGNYVYDGISGATPVGTPPGPGETTVRKVTAEDIRRAGFVEPTIKWENHTISPQISVSREHDYESIGTSLSHSIDLNEKNTTLTWGLSHSFDRILPGPGERTGPNSDPIETALHKDSTDLLVGITQLLGPRTVFSFNLTVGYADGFLSDPYKRVLFPDAYPDFPYTETPENRPRQKLREVAYFSLQQAFPSLDGALEGSYRFHHDDWGVIANTVTVQWHQKVTKWVTLTPLFRFYTQTKADFYGTHFAGDPGDPAVEPGIPQHYSSDYRLSDLVTYTYGIGASIHLHDHVSVDLAYKRYEMFGTDHETAADMYPKAHAVTAGLSLWY